MARQKKNELDAILEQLKRSYSSETDALLEDSLLESEISEEDAELNEVLGKLFSNDDEEKTETQNGADVSASGDVDIQQLADEMRQSDSERAALLENDRVDGSMNDAEISDEAPHIEQSVESETSEFENINDGVDEQSADEDNDVYAAKQEVDDVLGMMFPSVAYTSVEEDVSDDAVDESATDSSEEVFDEIDDRESVGQDFVSDIVEEESYSPEHKYDPEYRDDSENEDPSSDFDEDTYAYVAEDKNTEEISALLYDSESDIDDLVYDNAIDTDLDETMSGEDTADIIDNEANDDGTIEYETLAQEDVADDTEPFAALYAPRKILNPEEYTYDPLQGDFGSLSFIKQNNDIDFDEPQVVINDEVKEIQSAQSSFDNDDISLFMKFGYNDEIGSHVSNEQKQNAIIEKNNHYKTESHKVPHGFCGKEFMDRSQVRKIQKRYKTEKRFLFVSSIIIAVLTTLVFAMDIGFGFSNKSGYLTVLAIELISVLAVIVLLAKKLWTGILAITKFDVNMYSVLLFMIAEYLLYNIFSTIAYLVSPGMFVDTSSIILFGSAVILYSLVIVVCDLLDCYKSGEIFGMISRNETLYTAEKRSAPNENNIKRAFNNAKNSTSGTTSTFQIVKTHLISGYFKRMSLSQQYGITPVYLLGVVPVVSVVIGCFVAVFGESTVRGVNALMITSALCMPASVFLCPMLSELVLSIKLMKNGAAFIGYDAVTEHSNTEYLIFDDVDAVEIVSYTEINPNKNSDSSGKYVDMSYELFRALGGPLGSMKHGGSDQSVHEVVINSISDNGIDVYFDSSTNILMGDRQYMLSHGIKVKIDTNLITAARGSDRYVIYMAFDGKPQLGFIINSKIKAKFADTLALLDENGVKTCVKTYDPEINEWYFEQNKAQSYSAVTVLKSSEYESDDTRRICDGSIIAEDATGVAKAIVESRKTVVHRNKLRHVNTVIMIAGTVMATILSVLMALPYVTPFMMTLRILIPVAFYLCVFLGFVPGICYIFKNNSKKKNIKDQFNEYKNKRNT